MLLERSQELARLSDALAAVAKSGRGRAVAVAGEAGIGKTALVREFCEGLEATRVLTGACEALSTPRPLGPLIDIAADGAAELGAAFGEGANPSGVLPALLSELDGRTPTVMVLEDLHWADEATLDVVRLLARRVATVRGLVIATYRDDLSRDHPLRILLGDLSRETVERVQLRPLSTGAIATLAEPLGVDAQELHDRTAGNPFYVTEVLAAGTPAPPNTVRDAVLARSARLDDGARALLDAVAIMPPRAELGLLEAIAPDELAHLEQCLASGMLHAEGDAVAFRHEIARVAIEEALPPDRSRELHRRVLDAATRFHQDPARLAHHAAAAGDAEAVLRYAPAAGDRAAALGAHREAAAQFALALRFADGLPTEERIDLLERRSYECYLTGETREAIDARRRALEEHRARGDLLRTGDAHRWLSRLAWFEGDRASAEHEAEQAIALLEQVPPSRELAMAYSNQSQLGMLARDLDGALTWGRRALELAQRLDEQEIVVHALNNVGTAELQADPAGGAKTLERGLELALAAGFEEHAARAYTNLGAASIDARVYNQGDEALAAGISYCRERDLDAWWRYMTSWVARSHLEQGRWDDAAHAAAAVLDRPGVAAPSRINALVVIGRLRARRGDPDVWGPLDEAGELARSAAEVQRQGPVAAARAEARWLAGEPDLIGEETEEALALALAHEHEWVAGELYAWRRRAGISVPDQAYAAEPFRLELDGQPEQAAAAWRRLGCPYEAALALLESGDESELRRSLADLQELGARAAAAHVARALRERGARDLPRGPQAATRANPAGLTARELEVLELLVQGKRNAQIAGQLVLSEKTVGHHVSAILRKLGVSTRTEAATQARLLGIVER